MRIVDLPRDEGYHKNQAIEWWYFNGFLKSKNKKYAFMHCLFQGDSKKINLSFLRRFSKKVCFSHTLLYDLTKKKVYKEVLPFVVLSKDSFKKKNLYINYYSPLRKAFFDYEISRNKNLRLKTKYFELEMKEKKKPLLENQTGYINLGEKSTYYYTYPNLEVKGNIGKEKVDGIAWHDRQWSSKGYQNDKWLWFSIQLKDNTQIVCFDYKGKKMATISYPDNILETLEPEFKPLSKPWKSKNSNASYVLEWEIKIGKYLIRTKPIIQDCEMHFGRMHYWEGPLDIVCNGKKAKGFMEYLAEKESNTKFILEEVEKIPFSIQKVLRKII